MKKVVVLSVFALFTYVVSAQTTRYDVNVYSNPLNYVEYTAPMGNAYQKMMQMYQEADRNAIERERLELERERMQQAEMMEMRRISAAARAEGQKIVSDEIVTFNGTNLATKLISQIKVHIVKRKNGTVEMTSLGIKKGEVWMPCNKDIISLQEIYQSAVSNQEKSAILGLMDYGNYLLETDDNVFILK